MLEYLGQIISVIFDAIIIIVYVIAAVFTIAMLFAEAFNSERKF